MASDHVGRSFSNSDREPTVQGAVKVRHCSGVLIDGFVSNSALATTEAELGLGLGHAREINGVSYTDPNRR